MATAFEANSSSRQIEKFFLKIVVSKLDMVLASFWLSQQSYLAKGLVTFFPISSEK